jgi:HrpA-like RNA helicase
MPSKGGGKGRKGGFTSSKQAVAPGKVQETAVSEADRVHYLRLLTDLRDGMDTEAITFPPTLSNVQRAFIHKEAINFGLVSKSRGKGEARQLTVSKPSVKTSSTGAVDDELPWLAPPGAVVREVTAHCARFAVTDEEKAGVLLGESFSTPWAGNGAGNGAGHGKKRGGGQAQPWRPDPKRHHAAQAKRASHPRSGQVAAARRQLPSAAYRERVQALVKGHQVVLISGETGCGKTTQVPQFLLDDPEVGPYCSIVCTQPRRISAISVAERIAQERCEQLGQTVGFAVRSESSLSAATQLSFVTPGLLLRRLSSDPSLERYTHVIIDEVHEQDKYSEFLLMCVRSFVRSFVRHLKSLFFCGVGPFSMIV